MIFFSDQSVTKLNHFKMCLGLKAIKIKLKSILNYGNKTSLEEWDTQNTF